MRKNKLYILIFMLTLVLLICTATLVDRCTLISGFRVDDKENSEIGEEGAVIEKETEEELEKDINNPEIEEGIVQEELEELSEEDSGKKEEELEDIQEELEAPTIELKIYEGPLYSEEDGVCYWRVEAIVSGNPTPNVEFSRDDSGGSWGGLIAQVNLNNYSDSYNLIATATNSEGSATDSQELTWGCEEEPPGGKGGGDDDGEDFEPPEWEGRDIADFPEMTFHPFDIGYIVYPTGVNTTELIIGDSISNMDVRGFFAFDLISLRGKEILDATLTVTTYKYYPDPGFKGEIFIGLCNYLPLDPSDYESFVNVIHYYPNDLNPLDIGKKSLRYPVQQVVNDSCILGFRIWYEEQDTDWDHEIDGREYSKDSISLTIRYAD